MGRTFDNVNVPPELTTHVVLLGFAVPVSFTVPLMVVVPE